MRTRARITLAGLVLGAATLAGSVAWATIPDAAGVIHGCYRTSTDDQKGQLRIVDDPASCRSNETAIQWNEKGSPGAAGPAGPAGPQGAEGDNGSDGAVGPQGPKGDTGAEGTDGTEGADGTDGADGAAGAPGDSCLPIDPACVGPKGDKGDTGPAGSTAGAVTYIVRNHEVVGNTQATVFCLENEKVTGGGGNNFNGGFAPMVLSRPVRQDGGPALGTNARGWSVAFAAAIGTTSSSVFVICAS